MRAVTSVLAATGSATAAGVAGVAATGVTADPVTGGVHGGVGRGGRRRVCGGLVRGMSGGAIGASAAGNAQKCGAASQARRPTNRFWAATAA